MKLAAALPPILTDRPTLDRIVTAWPGLTDTQRARLAPVHPALWAMYASGGTWIPAPHLLYLAGLLLQLVAGAILRLCVSIPPQHGKSELISVYFPTWFLGRFPEARVLQCSYGQELTVEWTGRGRDMIAEHGPAVFGVDTWARAKKTAWNAYVDGRKLGGVRGVGKGGGVAGRAVDLGICDDLTKDQAEADALALREMGWKWLRSAVLPRARRLAIVGTRWHHDDHIGRLMAAQAAGQVGDPWTFVNVPAVAEEGDPLGRAPGAGLWLGNPVALGDPDWYAKKRREVGPYVWSALYQGQPTPAEGGIFKRRWLAYYERSAGHLVGHGFRFPEAGLFCYTTVDPAWSKRTSADHTAIASWGLDRQSGRLFLLEMIRQRFDAPEMVQALRGAMGRNGSTIAYVEANNWKLDQMRVLRESGLPMREIQPNADKVSRAMPVTAHMASDPPRLLLLKDAPWLHALEDELLKFGPGSKEDDQVDALSYGVHVANEHIRSATPPPFPGASPGGGSLIPQLRSPR